MTKLSKYRVLVLGVLSPIMAILLSVLVNDVLMRWSADHEKDWLFRLSMSTVVMVAPFAITLVLAMKDRRSSGLLLSGKIGLTMFRGSTAISRAIPKCFSLIARGDCNPHLIPSSRSRSLNRMSTPY